MASTLVLVRFLRRVLDRTFEVQVSNRRHLNPPAVRRSRAQQTQQLRPAADNNGWLCQAIEDK